MKQKHLFIVAAVLLLALTAPPTARAYDDFWAVSPSGDTLWYNYVVTSGSVSAKVVFNSCYARLSDNVVIPSTVSNGTNTYTVTEITFLAFNANPIERIYVPSSVTTIPDAAFSAVRYLFYEGTATSDENFGAMVWVKAVEDGLYFADFNKTILAGCDTTVTTLNVPDNVTSIANYAFKDNTKLTSVNMGSNVTSIGYEAFKGCSLLKQLYVPYFVNSIGNSAFSGIYLLIYEGTATNGYYGAWGAQNWAKTIENGLYFNDTTRSTLLGGDPTLTSVDIPSTVTTIYKQAFMGHNNLQHVSIPSSVTSIGQHAFVCASLQSVDYDADSATTVGSPFRADNTYYVDDYGQIYEGSYNLYGEYAEDGSVKYYLYLYGTKIYVSIVHDSIVAPIVEFNIGSSVRFIPNDLLYGNNTLSEITIPEGVKGIGYGAFICTGLTTVNYNATRAVVNSFGYEFGSGSNVWKEYVFSQEYRYYLPPAYAPITTLNIGSNVQYIPEYLMYHVASLESVSLPASLDTIGRYVFAETGLTEVTIPDGVSYIDERAFCIPGLTEVTVSEGVKYIRQHAFGSLSLTTLNYYARRAEIYMGFVYPEEYIDEWDRPQTRYLRSQVSDLTLGDEVEYIPSDFLSGDSALTNLVIPASVVTIGSGAFSGTGLTEITIPATVDTLGRGAFGYCPNLLVVNYNPVNLAESGWGVFSGSEEWDTEVTLNISSGVKHIPTGIFGSMNISHVDLPEGLQSIGDGSFGGSALKSIYIPDSVTSVGSQAFADCPLDTVVIGNGLTTIKEETFAKEDEVSSIRRLTIGEKVSDIGHYAFAGMTSPDSIFVLATEPPTITVNTFLNMPTNARIIVPCGTVEDYKDAAYWNIYTKLNEAASCKSLITVISNNQLLGTVSGGGNYSDGTVATLNALPRVGNTFVGWADGAMDNPRLVLVNGDSSYTANFAAPTTEVLHDTLVVTNVDTITISNTVHDTVMITNTVYDTIMNTVYDTVTNTVYDTVTNIVYDTVTNTVYDTVTNTVYDTVTNTVYDTVTNTVYDTVTNTVYDTVTNTVYDTVTNIVYDTVTNTVYDTIDNYIFDTTTVYQTDTLWMYDTIILHDTVLVRDTVYVGIDEVQTLNAKIYSQDGHVVVEGAEGNAVALYDVSGRLLATRSDEGMPLRFDVPASGAYLVRIGQYAARRVVVIR